MVAIIFAVKKTLLSFGCAPLEGKNIYPNLLGFRKESPFRKVITCWYPFIQFLGYMILLVGSYQLWVGLLAPLIGAPYIALYLAEAHLVNSRFEKFGWLVKVLGFLLWLRKSDSKLISGSIFLQSHTTTRINLLHQKRLFLSTLVCLVCPGNALVLSLLSWAASMLFRWYKPKLFLLMKQIQKPVEVGYGGVFISRWWMNGWWESKAKQKHSWEFGIRNILRGYVSKGHCCWWCFRTTS